MPATVPDQSSLRRAVARVDLAAITANVEFMRGSLAADSELCAVVKANAYGHGIDRVAEAAVQGGATRLAVVTTAEAAMLARLELDVPILLLAPIPTDDLVATIETGAEFSAWTAEQILIIERAAQMLGRDVGVHIKVDTGMARFGARSIDEALAAIEAAKSAASVRPVGIWTHLATADEVGDEFFGEQLRRFDEIIDQARQVEPTLLAHAANSAATLRDPASHYDFVRCGISIYGLDPFHGDALERGLTPALSLHSYVGSTRTLEAGESVGYGRRFTAPQRTKIATVPIGYGDGWRRILSNSCEVLIGGQRYQQRGTISMDSLAIELGEGSTIEVGAPVTLIGSDGDQRISAEDVAVRADTINYEITCGLTERTTREYPPTN